MMHPMQVVLKLVLLALNFSFSFAQNTYLLLAVEPLDEPGIVNIELVAQVDVAPMTYYLLSETHPGDIYNLTSDEYSVIIVADDASHNIALYVDMVDPTAITIVKVGSLLAMKLMHKLFCYNNTLVKLKGVQSTDG